MSLGILLTNLSEQKHRTDGRATGPFTAIILFLEVHSYALPAVLLLLLAIITTQIFHLLEITKKKNSFQIILLYFINKIVI